MDIIISPVKELREKIGVSQRELADALNVHHSFIANLEANQIDVSADDEELQKKIKQLFEGLSNYAGIPKDELIMKQMLSNKNQLKSDKIKVMEQFGYAIEKMIGKKRVSTEEEFYGFIDELEQCCHQEGYCNSPLKVIRQAGDITQRELAQAAGVSQTLIARIELGEISLSGPYGHRIVSLIEQSLDIQEIDKRDWETYESDDLYDAINRCQNEYMEVIKDKNVLRVKNAFDKLKGNPGLSEYELEHEEKKLGHMKKYEVRNYEINIEQKEHPKQDKYTERGALNGNR